MALVYPNRYSLGMANLGFLSVYARINARKDALCERAFLPGRGTPEGAPVRTIESGRPLSDFDAVAFSLSFENDLLHLPPLLASGGIPPFREERRGGSHPFVLAGGFAASLNPEPSGVLADAVAVGDGERVVPALLDLFPFRPGDGSWLRELASVPGVYVPGGYDLSTDGAGRFAALVPRDGFPRRVRREEIPPGEVELLPVPRSEESEFPGMVLLETSRGCPRRCAFCAAAHGCPAFRPFPLETVRGALAGAGGLPAKVGLVGAAVLDWPPFLEFAREVLAGGGTVSPASVRADLVTEEVAEILARSGHRTVAVAPECGSPEVRARFGKAVADESFFRAARTLVRAGIVSFKLYFLLGLPWIDGEEEAEGVARFTRAFREEAMEEARALGRMGTVTVTLSPFVPKPFTPLQWAPQAREAEVGRREEAVRERLRGVANVRVQSDGASASIVQGYLGSADRRVAADLARVRRGRLRLGAGSAIDPEELLFREKGEGEPFPWEVVEGPLAREALWKRYLAVRRG